MNEATSIQVQQLTYSAQKPGSGMTAIADINGHKVRCIVVAQTRNGRRVETTRWDLDGKRVKFADLMNTLNGATQ